MRARAAKFVQPLAPAGRPRAARQCDAPALAAAIPPPRFPHPLESWAPGADIDRRRIAGRLAFYAAHLGPVEGGSGIPLPEAGDDPGPPRELASDVVTPTLVPHH